MGRKSRFDISRVFGFLSKLRIPVIDAVGRGRVGRLKMETLVSNLGRTALAHLDPHPVGLAICTVGHRKPWKPQETAQNSILVSQVAKLGPFCNYRIIKSSIINPD